MAEPEPGRANPFTLALDTQRQGIEAATAAIEAGRVAPEQLNTMLSVEVGQAPSEVVYTENKLELLHYESQTDDQEAVPILIVYALINKPYILDLQPDRSVVRRLLEAGHDVYLIDWNEPSRLDQHLTLEDYVTRYIENCVDVVCERSDQDAINLLGYCMGGTMAAMYAALRPEKVRNLGLMAAGLCFADTGGVLEKWGDESSFSPEQLTDTYGNAPSDLLDVGFALMDPVSNYVSKYVRLYDNIEDDDFVANFGRMERWLSEGIDVAGATFTQFVEEIYQDNALYENDLYLGNEHVDIENIDMPVLQITGEYDHLVPAEASTPFNGVIGSEDVTTIEYPTGHIGLSVSGSAHEDVWPRVADWYTERSAVADTEPGLDTDGDADAPSDDTEEPSDDTDDGSATSDGESDLEAIDGIGPTYADRLRGTGVETVADLAGADAATVAESAAVAEHRATEWIESATTRSD